MTGTRGSALARNRAGGGWSGLDPLLAEAVVLVLASSLDSETFTPGDPVINQGTAGADGNAKAGTGIEEPFEPGAAAYTATPLPGLLIDPTSQGEDFYYVDPIAALDVDTFTMFSWVTWTEESGTGGNNITAKIEGALGQGGTGWQIQDLGSATGINSTAALAGSGAPFGASVSSEGLLQVDETYLLVRRQVDEVSLDLFIDGVDVGTPAGDITAVTSTVTEHEWIFGRGKKQTWHGGGFWDRALTDAEIAHLATALAA